MLWRAYQTGVQQSVNCKLSYNSI